MSLWYGKFEDAANHIQTYHKWKQRYQTPHECVSKREMPGRSCGQRESLEDFLQIWIIFYWQWTSLIKYYVIRSYYCLPMNNCAEIFVRRGSSKEEIMGLSRSSQRRDVSPVSLPSVPPVLFSYWFFPMKGSAVLPRAPGAPTIPFCLSFYHILGKAGHGPLG